jgi:ATP synthase protein I
VPDASKDDRPPMVVGMYWVQQITTIAIEMALPALLGRLGDQRWGTEPWLVSIGALLGFAVGLRHLLKIARPDQKGSSGRADRKGSS